MLFPMETIPGGGAVNPTIDTETRAGGALLIALGVAYVWGGAPIADPVGTSAVPRDHHGTPRGVAGDLDSGRRHAALDLRGSAVIEFTTAALTFWYSTMRDDQPSTA